jgi:hypothetical protein
MAKSIKKHFLVDCPCGSGKAPADCHVDALDGRLRKRMRSLRPPGLMTGYSHERCYLRSTGDCSERLSREHYVSESVLVQLGKTLRVSGMPWQHSGESLDIGISSLAARILCERHNNALSPLDTEAGHFYSILGSALVDLERKTFSRKPKFHLVSGDALELWMLKVACGLYFAVGSQGGVRLSTTHTIDMMKVQRAFFEREWDLRGGLYFCGAAGSSITLANSASIGPLSMASEQRFSGTAISLLGFKFELLFDTVGTNLGPWSGLVRRPNEMILGKAGHQHSIIVTWPPGTPVVTVVMDQTPPRP